MYHERHPMVSKTPDGLVFTFEGYYVAQISVDFQTRLLLMKENANCEVIIEAPFDFLLDGSFYRVDPEDVSTVAPVLHLRMREVVSASASTTGQLKIDFGRDTSLSVAPQEDFESWSMCGLHAENSDQCVLIYCLPAGDVAIF